MRFTKTHWIFLQFNFFLFNRFKMLNVYFSELTHEIPFRFEWGSTIFIYNHLIYKYVLCIRLLNNQVTEFSLQKFIIFDIIHMMRTMSIWYFIFGGRIRRFTNILYLICEKNKNKILFTPHCVPISHHSQS